MHYLQPPLFVCLLHLFVFLLMLFFKLKNFHNNVCDLILKSIDESAVIIRPEKTLFDVNNHCSDSASDNARTADQQGATWPLGGE